MANQVASLTATITVDKGNLQKEVLAGVFKRSTDPRW